MYKAGKLEVSSCSFFLCFFYQKAAQINKEQFIVSSSSPNHLPPPPLTPTHTQTQASTHNLKTFLQTSSTCLSGSKPLHSGGNAGFCQLDAKPTRGISSSFYLHTRSRFLFLFLVWTSTPEAIWQGTEWYGSVPSATVRSAFHIFK